MLSCMRVYFCDESIAQSDMDITTVTAVGVRCVDIAKLDKVVGSFRDRLLREHILFSNKRPHSFELKGSYIKDRNISIYGELIKKTIGLYNLEIVSIVERHAPSVQYIDLYDRLVSQIGKERVLIIDYFAGISGIEKGCIVPVSSSNTLLVQLADIINSLVKAVEKKRLGLCLNRYELRILSLLEEYRGSRN